MAENVFTIEYILENGLNKRAYGFIYITKYEGNGMKYIGQRKFSRGWEGYKGSGIHYKNAEKLYGKNNFIRSIIAIAYSEEELNNLEIEFIKNHNAVKSDNYYNIAIGGKTNTGMRHSEETKIKMSEMRKGNHYALGVRHSKETRRKVSEAEMGEKNHNYGKIFSKEHRDKISKSCIGRIPYMQSKHHTEESRYKMSQSHKGVFLSDEHKRKISDAGKGRIVSEETKHKLSEANKGKNNHNYGKHPSQETREKISEANIKRAKKIICKTTKMVFSCMKEAADYYNCDSNGISKCCRGKINYSGKHPKTGQKLVWMYYDEYLKQQIKPT